MMEQSMKDDPEMVAQLALSLAGVSTVPLVRAQQGGATVQAPHAHMSTISQQMPGVPPPAHAHSSTTIQKPPDSFLDKGLIEAAAYLEGKSMPLPLKTADNPATSESSSALPWSIQNALFQQYGQFMLDRMLTKQTDSSTTGTVTATSDTVTAAQLAPSVTSLPTSQTVGKLEGETEPGAIEAQRDVYRRMLNYSSALATQQYYLSQYGYNYMQDRQLFSKSEPGQTSTVTTATAGHAAPNQPSATHTSRAQLPSIDSVLLNLSTKKSTATTTSAGQGTASLSSSIHSVHSIPANYGLQALANAAIEADPKGFHDAETERKDGQKSELEDITDTDDSNTMSPSDGSTGQIMSPPRNSYAHLMEGSSQISIPAAHSHSQQYSSLYQSKSGMGTLPSIQHFAALGKAASMKNDGSSSSGLQLPLVSGIKPSDLVAAAMKLKVEPSEEKDIADRAIQERITAHHLNAVQQQVQDLTAGALAAGNIDAAALLAKLQSANIESELQKHMERVYDYDDSIQHMQHEPMELTADGGSPGRLSRRKSRGRPTSIESLRDPLGRQSSTTSSLGANTSISGDGDERTYDCEICCKQFSHNDRLRRHRKIHTAEKPYKCDICGKGFKEKCNLKHHRYIHTGEKPYKCDTCGKSFNQRSSLKTHQKVHTGEKPFKCEICEKPFAQKYLLRQHMKKHIEINMPPQQ